MSDAEQLAMVTGGWAAGSSGDVIVAWIAALLVALA